MKVNNKEMEPRKLCEEAWQEIASKFPDFKVLDKGQKLKRVAKNKDIIFEIYFQASRYNCEYSVEFIPHIGIYSKSIKKVGINHDLIYDGDLGSLSSGKPYEWWQLAGASYKYTVEEVSKLIKIHIIPIFDYFENTQANIDRILEGSCTSASLLYYMYYFAGKNKAQQYFNKILKENKMKSRYISFYESLKRLLINLELMKLGYPPIDIKFTDRLKYYEAFDEYHVKHNISAMADMFARYLNQRLDLYLSILDK